MTVKEMAELLDLVWNINRQIERIYAEVEKDFESPEVSVLTNGDVVCVEFMGLFVWSSEEDYRELIDEEKNEYEPLEPYIRKQINEHIRKLKLLTV